MTQPPGPGRPNGWRFEVQARLLCRRKGVVVRDEVRRDSVIDMGAARDAARRFAADGFTVWIYRVDTGSGTAPVYHRVEVVAPASQNPAR